MRVHRIAAALAVFTGTLFVGPISAASSATAPYCGITWGSLAKYSYQSTMAPVVGARTGRHDCWDRLVVDLGGMPVAGYSVRYTDGVRSAGGGMTLSVAGGATLTVTVFAPEYDSAGNVTAPWSVGEHIVSESQFLGAGYGTFRDLVWGGGYEVESGFGLGVRARLPFRAFTLVGPGSGSRLVIDVAH